MLSLKNLKITLKSNNTNVVVESANFEVAPGEIVSISGANGSGKSSLLSAIMSHPDYKIVEGEMLLDNLNINEYSTNEKAALGIFLASQFVPQIEGLTLIQLLHKALKTDASILELNKTMTQYCDRFNIDKAFLSRDLNVGLSGGEKKQAMLLSLLALRPLYCILDEPDSGLDNDGVDRLISVIQYLNNNYNISFVIVSHSDTMLGRLNIIRNYKIENKCLTII